MIKPSHDPLQKWPRVFISYAREDGEAFASNLRKRLERQEPEITLWQDRAEMKGGLGWRVQIEEALDKVMFSVMVMTPAALRSLPLGMALCSAARCGGVPGDDRSLGHENA